MKDLIITAIVAWIIGVYSGMLTVALFSANREGSKGKRDNISSFVDYKNTYDVDNEKKAICKYYNSFEGICIKSDWDYTSDGCPYLDEQEDCEFYEAALSESKNT